MLFKEIVDARSDGRTTDAGHWRITKAHLSTSCSGELKSENNEWENETFLMKEYFKSIENWKYSDNAVVFLCYEC